MKVCSLDFCGEPVHGNGMCRKHSDLLRRYKLDVYNMRDLAGTVKCDGCGHEGDQFVVDHDHAHCPGDDTCADCLRGFLCPDCNKALGLMGDDPKRLEALASYIRWRKHGTE